MDILQKILESTKARLQRDKAQISFNEMRKRAEAIYKTQITEYGRESAKSSVLLSSLQNLTKANCGNPLNCAIKPPFAFEMALDSNAKSSKNLCVNSDSHKNPTQSFMQKHTQIATQDFTQKSMQTIAQNTTQNSTQNPESKNSQMRFICEVKKASPSKGVIVHDFPYLQIAQDYERAGANCVSCLTEPEYFLGADSYLRDIANAVKIPTLRKDFIIDSYMIYGAKVLGADCVLLISEVLELAQMRELCDIAMSLGLSVLVESHSEVALENALKTNAKLIGVNNRDLRDFKVDLDTSIRLKKLVSSDRIFVSESGISTRKDIELLEQSGINAVLIGESLMRESNKTKALAILKGIELC